MDYNFDVYLLNKLTIIAEALDFRDDNGNPDPVEIFVSEEQNFAKMNELKPNSIYVVIKYLSSDIEFFAETTPIQILVLSEQNSLTKAQMIMNKFANENNWRMITEGDTYIKQQYNSPVVLNNYVEVSFGYRSVLYVTGTLFILNRVMDVKDVSVVISDVNDGNPVDINPITATIGYTMSGDSQPFGGGHAITVKSFSTFALTLTVSCVNTPFTQRCVEIMRGNSTNKGNESFKFSFKIGELEFTDYNMKLISSTVTSAVNSVPSLQLSFSV